MSQAARKSIILNFECTSLFSSWWEDKWTKKYGGDLKETHDRLFNQLSLKSYPGSGELKNWNEMIQEKNRSLLIAPVDVESEVIESEDDSADAAILHGAAAKTGRREAGEGADASESFGDSGAEETPEVLIKAPKRKKAAVIKTSDPDPVPLPKTTRPTLTRKSKRARTTAPPKSSAPSAPVPKAGRKKQQSSRPQASKRPILASKEEPLRAAMLKKAKELQNTALKKLEAGASASLPCYGPHLRSMTSSTALDATPSSQFDPSIGVMLHFVDEDSNLPSPVYEPPPTIVVLDNEPIVPEIPIASKVAISRVFACPTVDKPLSPPQDQTQGTGTGSGAAHHSPAGGEKFSRQPGISPLPIETPGLSQQAPRETSPPHLVRKSKHSHPHSSSEGTVIPPSGIKQIGQEEIAPSMGIPPLEKAAVQDPPHSASPNPAKMPTFFEALGRLETRLKSSKHSSATPISSEQQRVLQEWAKKDFTASFSLKALCDFEKIITESFKAGRLSKPQHDSFLSFFENLRALREQYQRVDRQANRAKGFMEKESSTSAQVDRLMEESLQTIERVRVVTSKIQQLEKQLVALKAEQATLLDTLENQIEGVDKSNSELERARSQLVNNHTILAEPSRIFAIMKTYHSRIITLCEDVNFLE
ncbi:hypothetical protein PS1_000239 [Malus domestica]